MIRPLNFAAIHCGIAGLLIALTAAASLGVAQENNQPPAGYTALFDGKSLDGWFGFNKNPNELWKLDESGQAKLREDSLPALLEHWTVEDGEIVNDGHGAYLTTEKEYGDYELWIDYKTVARADSGIYLRATPQVQIWDYTDESKFKLGADKGSGGLWNNAAGAKGKDPLVLADKPFGEWNRFHIRQIGARTSVWLNGKLVVDHAIMHNYWDRQRPLHRRGPIQLQTHGGEIRWRNIFIREIGAAEANELLAQHSEAGELPSVFDGSSLEGWEGPTQNYEVIDGAVRCKPGKGGTIYTAEEYGDFVATMEVKIPPGGNNGLAIRYPGSGDTAYVGMCELQVLDSQHPKYAKLDPRQHHGSAYGMVAAHRGYLREAGKWNYQEVTVKGSTIKVELNGTVILDADLSKVTEFMGGRPHPGKDRKSGHFGFAGHGAAVEYRNVKVGELK